MTPSYLSTRKQDLQKANQVHCERKNKETGDICKNFHCKPSDLFFQIFMMPCKVCELHESVL